MLDFKEYRKDFPMLSAQMHGKPLIYFDTAATAQKPKVVIDAISNFYANHYGTVHRAIYELSVFSTDAYHQAREKIRAFLNAAKTEEIIFTRGATESINMVAYSFCKAFLKHGDEIILSELEHHSNIVPWQIACEDHGAVLKIIPCNDRGELLLDKYAELLSPKTKIVAFNHISNAIGTINPIKKMIKMAHDAGAKVLVDAAQSAPHMSLNVIDLDVDFLVFSGHKLYGPTGVGVLYGKEHLLNEMPPYQGGGDMIDKVTFSKTTYNHLPMKFEAGTPLFVEAIALGVAVDYVQQIGMESIEECEHSLFVYATGLLEMIKGLRIIGKAKEKGAIISFVVDGIHPLDLGTLLDLKGIAIRTGHHCAQPAMARFGVDATARVSFAFYNTMEEIDFFVKSLNECIQMLR